MSDRGRQDPRLQKPVPLTKSSVEKASTPTRQTPAAGDPGYRTQDRLFGTGPYGEAVDGVKRTRYVDVRIPNCTGLLANGNCNGDPYWAPPDGAWYNWPGIGGSPTNRSGGTIMAQAAPGNPSGFDFVGGQTTSNTPLVNWAVPIRTEYVQTEETALEIVMSRNLIGFGYGTGGPGNANYNCYSNCNCNCACVCVCVCVCNCQNSCFPAGTLITMEDGRQVPIEKVSPGDRVRGAFGVVNTVDDVSVGPIGDGSAFLLNGKYFVAGAHRVWDVRRGWVAADPAAWYKAMLEPGAVARFAAVHGIDDIPEIPIYAPESERPKQMMIGDRLAWGSVDNTFTIDSIDQISHDGKIQLYELICHNGSGSYEVYGGMWAVAAPDYSFPFQDYIQKDTVDETQLSPELGS